MVLRVRVPRADAEVAGQEDAKDGHGLVDKAALNTAEERRDHLGDEPLVEREELVAAIRQELAETETQLAALLARRSELNELLARNV